MKMRHVNEMVVSGFLYCYKDKEATQLYYNTGVIGKVIP